MKRSLYGLDYDYMEKRGIWLVLSRETGLSREDLQTIEYRMMEACDIPNTLALELEEIDMKLRLLYPISDKRMLSQWLMTGKLSPQQYFRFLLQLAAVIDDSKTYMLREEGYWLHEDFLFVDDDACELSVLYVPVKDVPGKPPIREQFRAIAARLAGPVAAEEGPRLAELMSLLYRENFEFAQLRKLLSGFLLEQPPQLRKAAPFEEANRSPADIQLEPVLPHGPRWIHAGELSENHEKGGQIDLSDDLTFHEAAEGTGKTPPSQKQILYAGGLTLSLLLLLWSFYPDDEGEAMLYIWAGASFVLFGAVFLFVRLRPEFSVKLSKLPFTKSWSSMEEREMTGLTGELTGPGAPAPLPFSSGKSDSLPAAAFVSAQEEAYKAEVPLDRTALLRPMNETVYLGPGGLFSDLSLQPSAWLETEQSGETVRVELNSDRFVIGREQGLADYIASAAGVSKLHLEITNKAGRYYAADLGSKNGTMLNGERMVTYKVYPLSEGDVVQLVTYRFVFHTAVSGALAEFV